jgi:hypothetical protein
VALRCDHGRGERAKQHDQRAEAADGIVITGHGVGAAPTVLSTIRGATVAANGTYTATIPAHGAGRRPLAVTVILDGCGGNTATDTRQLLTVTAQSRWRHVAWRAAGFSHGCRHRHHRGGRLAMAS